MSNKNPEIRTATRTPIPVYGTSVGECCLDSGLEAEKPEFLDLRAVCGRARGSPWDAPAAICVGERSDESLYVRPIAQVTFGESHLKGAFGKASISRQLCANLLRRSRQGFPAIRRREVGSAIIWLRGARRAHDLALEQISTRDIHYARFGLMLTDNAVELMLHQIATDKASERKMIAWSGEDYEHQVALDKALGRNFDSKLKFAKIEAGLTDEMAQTIATMHGYRNEVYHVGLRHESILPALAPFYFDVVCAYLETYKIRGLGWASNQKMPERAKKYFGSGDLLLSSRFDDFSKGCARLRQKCNHNPAHNRYACR